MMKHVFRIYTYGGLYHEGEYVKETEKTVTYRWGNMNRETRVDKRSVVMIETDEPNSVIAAYDAAWKRYGDRVDEARQALLTLERNRKSEALSSAKAAARS